MDNSKCCNRNSIHANSRYTSDVSYQSILGAGKQQQRSHIKLYIERCNKFQHVSSDNRGCSSGYCVSTYYINSEGVWINL
jgi:hypothetical protein